MRLKDGTDWQLTAEFRCRLQAAFPQVNIDAEFAKAELWCDLNPSRRKIKPERFLMNWCSRAKPKRSTSTRERTLREDLEDVSWAQ